MNDFLDIASRFLPLLLTLAVVAAVLASTDRLLRRHWREKPDAQFRFQLIMLFLTLAGLLAIVLALPVDITLRGQLLGLIGVLLSAAIALSSTTFIGNIMAGIMLKAVKNARPGDFITVADLTGRITEMDLLHTEVQTELRDLVTVPNLFMVTNPLKVVRASGSIITAEVSLGYDVPHTGVSEILRGAAQVAGLKDSFVHIRALGDFSITYRVAGLLEDIQSLISARSNLMCAMLDALHEANIEIVSPNFMNTRALSQEQIFIPPVSREKQEAAQVSAEAVAFDKAEDAASMEKIRAEITRLEADMEALKGTGGESSEVQLQKLENERNQLLDQLGLAEKKLRSTDSE